MDNFIIYQLMQCLNLLKFILLNSKILTQEKGKTLKKF